MDFRKFLADRVFDGYRFLEKDTVVVTDADGVVMDLVTKSEAGEGLEKLQGTLLPGFINCHCHLELSHLKDLIPEKTGLVNFLISVVKNRKTIIENKEEKIKEADAAMYNAGIAAVVDICNTTDAIVTKSSSKMRWHNLVEILNFYDVNLHERLAHNIDVLEQYKVFGKNTALTPHAPYSVSPATYDAINELTVGETISIHNQETGAEDELFKNGTGDFLKLFSTLMDGKSPFAISGKSSLQTYLPHFTNEQTIILVHNTFITEEDILFAKNYAEKHGLDIAYCLCPNANLYIEGALPPVELLMKNDCAIVLGTDSYSSNWQLSIASEIKTLQKHFPKIPLETILKWSTSDAAKLMKWDKELGSFEKGKAPGIVLLKDDFSSQRIL